MDILIRQLDRVHEWMDTNQAKPPREAGVYFIYCSGTSCYGHWCELLYVGSTNNLRRRLSGHKIFKSYKKVGMRITYKPMNDYRAFEKLAIQRFAPLANIHHQ